MAVFPFTFLGGSGGARAGKSLAPAEAGSTLAGEFTTEPVVMWLIEIKARRDGARQGFPSGNDPQATHTRYVDKCWQTARNMTILKYLSIALILVAIVAAAVAVWSNAGDRRQARVVWEALEMGREPDPPRYDRAMVAGMPEVAQRYFDNAIEPGTPLHRTVQLEMEGVFVLNGNHMAMRARQILAPPARGFVWEAVIGSGVIRFSGSDGYHLADGRASDSWTTFWQHDLIPLAPIDTGEDHVRAAATRIMLESVWAPASLLPQFGARWTQTGSDSAEIAFDEVRGIEPMHLTFDAEGKVTELVALRWSDANAESVYRLQPFGGRVLATGRFGGFAIPTRVELGNFYGTGDYAPFFIATVTDASY